MNLKLDAHVLGRGDKRLYGCIQFPLKRARVLRGVHANNQNDGDRKAYAVKLAPGALHQELPRYFRLTGFIISLTERIVFIIHW